MSLVFRPERYVADFGKFRIILRSDEATQDWKEFEEGIKEFKKLWDSINKSN